MERIQNSGVDDDPPVSATPSHTYHSPAPNPPHPNSLRDDSSRYNTYLINAIRIVIMLFIELLNK